MTNNARPRHAAQGRASRIAGRTALGVLGAPIAMLAVAGPAGAATLDLNAPLDDNAPDLQLAADSGLLPGLDALGVPALPTELPDSLPTDGVAFQGVNLDLFNLGGQDDFALPALPGASDVALPGTDALPSTDELPVAGALAAVPVALPSLPTGDDLGLPELPSLPSTDDLGSLPVAGALAAVPVALPSLPSAGDQSLPELPALPSADDLPSLPSASDLPSLPVDLPQLPVDVPALPSTDDLPSLPDAAGPVGDLAGNLPTSTNLDLDNATGNLPTADVFSATDLVQGLI